VNVLRHWARKSDGKGIRVQGFFADTACFHHLLAEEGPHSLDVCADEEFGYGDYSEPVRNICGQGRELINTYDCVPDEILWPYTATDAEATFRLYEAYLPRLLAAKHLFNLYCEETEPMSKGLAEAEYYGHKLDEKVIDNLIVEYEKRQADLLVTIRRQTTPEFNPNSTNDVIQAVINKGFADRIRDKKKNSGYTVNKKMLMDIRDECPLAGDILDFRSQQKIISTYLVNAKNDMDGYGMVRHSWFPLAVTGRLTCTFFHQIPKVDQARVKAGLPILRDIFIAEDGYDLVQADYKQVELFILAIVANDKEMRAILSDKTRDLHGETTYEFLKDFIKGYTLVIAKKDKFNRAECGKRINFGIGYGSTGASLVKTGKWKDEHGQERSFTWPMLNQGLAAWKKKFYGVANYIDNYPDECRMNFGTATSAFMRERRVANRLNGADEYVRGEAERECINFKVQSSAGSITNRTIGMIYLTVRGLIEKGIISEGDIRLVNTVHDSVIYQTKSHLTEWFIKHILIPIGQRPIKELENHCFEMGVGYGPNWTQAELREAA
jgi:DNA polymerase-1